MASAPDFAPSSFFVIRSPLLPFDGFTTWWRSSEDDPASLRARLRACIDEPAIREALFIASPSLHADLPIWIKEPGSPRADQIERSLVRYFERMSTRSTPFGLFAGLSTGEMGRATNLVRGLARRRSTRLDMQYLTSLSEALEKEPDLRARLRWFPNNSAYLSSGRLRMVEARTSAMRIRSYHLVSIDGSDYLVETLERAKDGARLDELAEPLAKDDVSYEEALEYVNALADNQVLVSELEPPITGEEPIHPMIATLRSLKCASADRAASTLDSARSALVRIDAQGPPISPDPYLEVARSLEGLPAPVELSRLFQVDLAFDAPELTLGPRVIKELSSFLDLYQRLAVPKSGDVLSSFRAAFTRRWEGQVVPLLDVLDEESGISLGSRDRDASDASPLLEDLDPPMGGGGSRSSVPPGDAKRFAHIVRLFEDARARGHEEIALSEEDLSILETGTPYQLPDSFQIVATILARSSQAIDLGDFRLLVHSIGGPPGAALLGRFCHSDPALRARVEALTRAEEALVPEAMFAEIVHLPQGRVGNVMARPLLRKHEIPYLGVSGAPRSGQIPVSDLLVAVENQKGGERVVLYHAQTGREVIPRNTTMHNFELADVGIYRFLCALQSQPPEALVWDWRALGSASFSPRVRWERLIMRRATWRLDRREIETLRRGRGAQARFEAAKSIRVRRQIPRFALFIDGDQNLPVDFDNALSVDAFVQVLPDREEVFISEMLEAGGDLPLTDGVRPFGHEIVVPFTATRSGMPLSEGRVKPKARARLAFAPGSEWLTAKLYAGTSTVDRVLVEVVRPLVNRALTARTMDSWFFIRYGDPDWHLRLRFHGDPNALLSDVLPALEEASHSSFGIQRLELATYEREIHRYGGPEAIELIEELFRWDSEAALEIIESFAGEDALDARWRLAIAGIDMLFDDLGLDFEEKRTVTKSARDSLFDEIHADARFDHQLDKKFRRERSMLDAILERDLSSDAVAWLRAGMDVLERRSKHVRSIGVRLRSLALARPLCDVAASLAHMHANRMLRSAARLHETVMHDLLVHAYDSRVARRGVRL